MKKENLLLSLATVLLMMACLVTTSCSKSGKQFAQKENKLYAQLDKQLVNLDDDFTSKLDVSKYSCRRDAIEEYKSRKEEIAARLEKEYQTFRVDYNKVLGDLKAKKMAKFLSDYNNNIDNELALRVNANLMTSEPSIAVLSSIANIVSPKPDAAKIQKDLSATVLTDDESGYFFAANRKINLKDYDVSQLQVLEVQKDLSNSYVVEVAYRISGKNNPLRAIDVRSVVCYILPTYDDWSIDFQRVENLTPINDPTYHDCVSLFVSDGLVMKDLYVRNTCDKSLDVFVTFNKYGQWYKKIVTAKPQEDTFVDYGKPDEYKIECVLPL